MFARFTRLFSSESVAPARPQAFAVTVVSPPGYPHSAAFNEVAETLYHGLCSLGHDCVRTNSGDLPERRHIVLGSNLIPGYNLPLAPDAILYNLEQVDAGSNWLKPQLLALFRRHTLWDYSERNQAAWRSMGVDAAAVLPIGYVPQLTRIEPAPQKDIDVLFIGSMNARRQHVMDRLAAAGLKATAAFGIYGKQRDALIARAKVLLNVHFYEAKVLEMVRISYLLANRCAVLSEHSSLAGEDAALAGGVAFADYEGLVQRATELVADDKSRDQLAAKGFQLMRARPIEEGLRQALRI